MHGSSLKYAWLSDGTKVSAKADDGNGNGVQKRYLGSFVLTSNTEHSADEATEVESIAWDEGRIFFDVPVAVDDPVDPFTFPGELEPVMDSVIVDSTSVFFGYRDCWFAGDHLGNVRSVIDITPNLIAPQVLEQSNYLPYGTRIQGQYFRSAMADNRWRFAGKEEQDFTPFSTLNISLLDFGARMYDPFIARWTAVDPFANKFIASTPYNYCGGGPLNCIDPDGRTIFIYYGQNNSQVFTYTGRESDDDIPDDYYVKAVIEAYKYNKMNWEKAGLDGQCPSTLLVEREDIKVSVYQKEDFSDWYYMDNGRRPCIIWNPNEGCQTDLGIVLSPATLLSHEADHALDDLTDADNHYLRHKTKDPSFDTNEERRVILGSERKTAFANGEIKKEGFTRKNHKGITVYTSSSTTIRFDPDKSKDYRKQKKH